MQSKDDISGALDLLRSPYLDRSLLPYQVPERYFSVFPQHMLQLAIKEDAASPQTRSTPEMPLAGHAELPYLLPAGYFSEFPARMMERIGTIAALPVSGELELSAGKSNPFRLDDERYFENFVTQLLHRIRTASEEAVVEETLSPVLTALKSKNVFEVPEGYFEAKTPPQAIQKPLIPAHPAHKSIKWSSWIAAAGILLIFTLGGRGLFINSSGPAGDAGLEVALNALSEQEIAEYLEMTMSEYELAGFYADHASRAAMLDDQASEQLLNDIPIEDIKAYIEGGGF